ncbi:Transcription initiation factor TFIID subunit 11 [Dictyocoela roeselum]|nr:Transcription initiation factor TFIID subunit 11 [Dictyocoela roeselum]
MSSSETPGKFQKNPSNQTPPPTANNSDSDSETRKTSSSDQSYHLQKNIELQKRIDQMDEKELHRYESFRRSGFSKNSIRKIVSTILNQACNPNFIIAIAGVAKVFVGEIIDEALKVQSGEGMVGPLMPRHIHEAYRRLYKKTGTMRRFRREYF